MLLLYRPLQVGSDSFFLSSPVENLMFLSVSAPRVVHEAFCQMKALNLSPSRSGLFSRL